MAVVVTLSPKTPTTINHGATRQFSALVTGNANTTVTWSKVSGVGSIDASGLYTASASGAVTIKATANADGTTNDTFAFTVNTVVIPATPDQNVIADETLQMPTPAVTGAANPAVTWTKVSGNGTITSGGLYSAGLVGTDVVRATSTEDGSKTADVNVIVAHAVAGARKVHILDAHNDFIQAVVREYLNKLNKSGAEYTLGQAALDSLKAAF